MRWAPLHPRQAMVIALAAFAMMLFLSTLTAPDLASLDLSIPSGGAESAVSEPVQETAEQTGTPAWVTDPMASPLRGFDPQSVPTR